MTIVDNSYGYARHRPTITVAGTRFVDRLRVIIPGLMLAALMISMQPFNVVSTVQSTAGETSSAANQVGFSLLGMISIAAILMIAIPRRVFAAIDLFWIAALVLVTLSTLNSPSTVFALKTFIFTMMAILTCTGILTIPANENQLRKVFLIGIGLAIALSYFGIFLRPEAAIHSAAEVEAQHAGLWRGHFSHKNIAGPVMAMFVFFGIYFYRSGNRMAGTTVFILSLLFVLQTGSKTTNGLLPIVIGTVAFSSIFGLRFLTVLTALVLLASGAALTVGTVLFKPLEDLVIIMMSDPTYTGRDTLWAFGLESVMKKPWTGYGYDGFWLKPAVLGTDLPFDAPWDYREIVHGHSNYVDILLMLGIPAGIFMIFVLCLRPLWNYLDGLGSRENRLLADLFMMIVLFAALNSFLESFWFRRADPVWVLMVLGLFGLRLTSRINFAPSRNG